MHVKSESSGDGSSKRIDPMIVLSSQKSSTAGSTSDVLSHSRAAEAWLSRSSRTPLSDAMNRCESSQTSSDCSIPVRVSLRERLQARMKEVGKQNEPLHAEDTLRLLTKGLSTQMASPPPPPPPPHPTSCSQVGRKSPRELDAYLETETTEYESIPSADAAPPPPRVSARARSPKKPSSTLEDSQKKQKIASTSDAVSRIMKAIHDKQQQQHEASTHETSQQGAARAPLLRISRNAKYGKKVETKNRKDNSIKLHIYDLLTNETYMQVGWGCEFPIGQCFNAMNDGLHALGTGAYHCGIEVRHVFLYFKMLLISLVDEFLTPPPPRPAIFD